MNRKYQHNQKNLRNQQRTAFRILGAAILSLISVACTSLTPQATGIAVNEVGSFHVGGRAAVLSGLPEYDLPLMGITGNTHMIMMDRNSDQIAALVSRWLIQQGLSKP